MRLAYAFFARCAELMRDQTIGMIGGCFDAIRGPSLPLATPGLAIVIRVRCLPEECGRESTLQMKILGPSGDALPVEPPILRFTPEDDHGVAGVTSVISIFGLVFPMAGDYRFVISVNQIELGAAVLTIHEPTPEVPQ